ncbi:MAG: hypothetical protein JL50_14385 [Peptococcaceae bacterium BICA1-7]|nr:MAG: hypothetical protein JL50_14385 [Peptococcaceae bacterium BICA1-7]HBV96370.1 class I SAM-dependent methyltransferase [Desulfotomaculum sp.]
MTGNLYIKEQFNKQADRFNNWTVTRDERIHQSLCQFLSVGAEDRLLDLACGTGAFAIYAAQRAKFVQCVDISESMIEIAIERARQLQLDNINFLCRDVEKVPFTDNSFQRVISKSAFHHMKNYPGVFKEMARCCQKHGRIGLEDIIAYDDTHLDQFFEELECTIDISHNWSLSRQEIINLYKQNEVRVLRLFESISLLNFTDYVNHAVQTAKDRDRINRLIRDGLNDSRIAQWLVTDNGILFWKRKIITVVGEK